MIKGEKMKKYYVTIFFASALMYQVVLADSVTAGDPNPLSNPPNVSDWAQACKKIGGVPGRSNDILQLKGGWIGEKDLSRYPLTCLVTLDDGHVCSSIANSHDDIDPAKSCIQGSKYTGKDLASTWISKCRELGGKTGRISNELYCYSTCFDNQTSRSTSFKDSPKDPLQACIHATR